MLGNVNFKGVDSSTFGLLINYDNITIKPALRNSTYQVIGKDGGHVFTDKHSLYEIVLECRLKDTPYERRVTGRQISAWLQGYGELVLGIEQDVKYNAWALSAVETAPIYVLEDFFISFLVEPVRKSTLEGEDLIWSTADIDWGQANVDWGGGPDLSFSNISSGSVLDVENIGNYEARPIMEISGQATTLSITDDLGNIFTFSNLNGTIYVDSENYLVYSGTDPKVNGIQSSNGEFIALAVGVNTIDVSGTGFVSLGITFVNASAFI